MELNVKGSFYRDAAEWKNTALHKAIFDAVTNVRNASDISQIQFLVKLKKYTVHYCIQVATDYRIGIIIRKNTVWFIRFAHRNSFYEYFP